MTAVGRHWSVTTKREREAELLFRGTRIEAAIEILVKNSPMLTVPRLDVPALPRADLPLT
jgi:hypothetical protein